MMGLSTRQIPYISATVVLFAGGILFFAFPVRNLFHYYEDRGILLTIPIAATVYMGLLFIFVVANFFLCSFVDPGIYPREQTDEEDDFRQPLYRVIEINNVQVKMKWCDTCKFYRPPRCSHCSLCDNCVEKFDHHCPWVDNCVGKRNYKFFFYFIVSLNVFILSGFAWGLLSIWVHRDELSQVVVEFILLFVGVLIFIPVVGLAGFHVGLVALGRTTNEHVTGKFRSTHNPYNMGCCRNCCNILCIAKKPRYMHYKTRPYVPGSGERGGGGGGGGGEGGGGGGGRAASYIPRSTTNTTRPINDMRCMPVYEELDPAGDSLPSPPQHPGASNGNTTGFQTSGQINPLHTQQHRLSNGLMSGESGEVVFSGSGQQLTMAEVTV